MMDKLLLKYKIEEGLSTYKLAAHFGKSPTTIRYWLKKYGLNTKLSQEFNCIDFKNGKKCVCCEKELTGMQTKFCSNNCKVKTHYKQQPNTNKYQKDRSRERKLKFVELKGGKCQVCDYNKNLAALCFHHRDPTNKSFNLDARRLANTSEETLKLEVDKCDLLCQNCHMEIHFPESNIN